MVIICGQNSFWGFVSCGEQKYTFEVILPEKSQESLPLLKVDWRLQKMLGVTLNKFLEVNVFSDPVHFHNQLCELVNNSLNMNKKTENWLLQPIKTSALLRSFQQEIRNIQNYVKDFDIENGLVRIEVSDAQSRTHRAVLKLSQNYKFQPITVVNHDLPLQKSDMSKCTSNLENIFSITEFCTKFSELITCFQQFWNMTAIIDSQCCILDPPSPTFKDTFRRIKLSDTMSAVLTFNPFCSCQVPNIKLLGCQADVIYHQAILQKNLENELWDIGGDFMLNLSNILEISIPNKICIQESEPMDTLESGECAICFTSRLENNVPNETCENPNCNSVYHSICLFTYLSSIPRNRDYFGKIQGECPNCDDIIICTVPKLMC